MMKKTNVLVAVLLVGAAAGLAARPASARDTKHDAAPSVQAPPQASSGVSSEPQQTSATFADWVVRCERPPGSQRRLCEAAQALIVKGQQGPIAQIAFGHAPEGKTVMTDASLTLAVLLPVNIAFDKPPKLSGSDESQTVPLTFRRCVPGGCLTEGKLTAEFMKDLRGPQKTGHLTFTDAAERTLTLPISLSGLGQALDDLARESAKDEASQH